MQHCQSERGAHQDRAYNSLCSSEEHLKENIMERETYLIGGQEYPRVKYGNETTDWGAERQPCRHCQVTKGQFHIVGCFTERCPCCGGQAMTCACPYESLPVRRPISAKRQLFYKAFYLALLPAGCLFAFTMLTGLKIHFAFLLAVPTILLLVFWRRMRPIELCQIVPVAPSTENDQRNAGQ